jgi:hypothetical protein
MTVDNLLIISVAIRTFSQGIHVGQDPVPLFKSLQQQINERIVKNYNDG